MIARVVCLSVLSLGLALCCIPVQAGPILTIDPPEFDFGYVPQNSQISRVFQLRNDGDDTLFITKVVPGCGCTKTPLEKSTLAPGESTEMEIIFSTRIYNGKVSKRPRIETNESSQPRYVPIYANVVTRADSTYPLQVKPYKLDLSQFGTTVRDQMKFTLANVSDTSLGVTLVYFPDDLVMVDVPKSIGARADAGAVVHLDENALEQSFDKSITIQTDDQAGSRYTIPIKRQVRSPLGRAVESGSDTR
jgi:hypothetical protein